jgi:hypothetical protein
VTKGAAFQFQTAGVLLFAEMTNQLSIAPFGAVSFSEFHPAGAGSRNYQYCRNAKRDKRYLYD